MEIDDDTKAGLLTGGNYTSDPVILISWLLYRQDHGNPHMGVPLDPHGIDNTRERFQIIMRKFSDGD